MEYVANLLDQAESPEGYVEPIATAFEDYVVMRNAFRECPGPRIDWIRKMLRGSYRAKRLNGTPIPVVRYGNQVVGAANLYLPDMEASLEAKEWWPAFLEEAGDGTRRFFERFFEFTESVAVPPSVLLGMIGVRPQHQGKGAGRALLRHVIEIAGSSPVAEGVSLDTEVESNVGLYQRFGFHVVGEGKVDDMPVWVMFRPNA